MNHRWAPAPAVAAILIEVVSGGCASRQHAIVGRDGVTKCPPAAAEALLAVDALQCWFAARHGQWRTLSHDSHFDVLLVQVEAFDLRDAEEIAQQFVVNQRQTYSEIMVYVQAPARTGVATIRRVRWTRQGGSDTLEFEAPPRRRDAD
jgi:hypothetical protein